MAAMTVQSAIRCAFNQIENAFSDSSNDTQALVDSTILGRRRAPDPTSRAEQLARSRPMTRTATGSTLRAGSRMS
jgi:hypothetical protein